LPLLGGSVECEEGVPLFRVLPSPDLHLTKASSYLGTAQRLPPTLDLFGAEHASTMELEGPCLPTAFHGIRE
jgi:hypothetical protein